MNRRFFLKYLAALTSFAYFDPLFALVKNIVSVDIRIDSPGRLGFYIDYSERTEIGEHTFYVCRTHGTSGEVSVEFSTSGDPHTVASGTLTWADGDAGIKSFTVDVPDKTDGDHRIVAKLSNPTGGSLLHFGETHTLAHGVIDDNSIAPDSAAVFFDADAVTNGNGTIASPYNNIYDAITNVGNKRYIYGKGTTVPDGTNKVGPYAIQIPGINVPASRTSESARLYIRNWPGFTCKIQGHATNDTYGIFARNNESYHTYRGIVFSDLVSATTPNAGIWYHYGSSQSINVEKCSFDNIDGNENQGAVALYGVDGGKVWRCRTNNIKKLGDSGNENTAGFFTYDGKNISVQRCEFSNSNASVYHKRIGLEGDTSTAMRFCISNSVRVHYGRSGSSGAGHSYTVVQNNLFKGQNSRLTHQTENELAPGGKHAWSNNVFDGVAWGENAAIQFQTANLAQIYNNIMINCQKVWAKFVSQPSILIEYADYNHEHGTVYTGQRYEYDAINYGTASALCEAEGLACHDSQGDPLFVDVASNNYRLGADSPCIASGVGGTDKGIYLVGIEQIGPNEPTDKQAPPSAPTIIS